jgi:hypothetical protein
VLVYFINYSHNLKSEIRSYIHHVLINSQDYPNIIIFVYEIEREERPSDRYWESKGSCDFGGGPTKTERLRRPDRRRSDRRVDREQSAGG